MCLNYKKNTMINYFLILFTKKKYIDKELKNKFVF